MRREDELEKTLGLWYALGGLYSEAVGGKSRAARLGFTVTLVSGALVLLSVPVLGTAWAGPFAAALPVAAGLFSGGGLFVWKRLKLRRRTSALGRELAKRGEDPARPGRDGLTAYYDPQLILLRSEYEYLQPGGFSKSARLFEESFGFTPEDGFETGPLNVSPDTRAMRRLRQAWERRLAMRRERGVEPPPLGLHEDLAYRVFPREMTVPVELAVRCSYLEVSREALLRRYGKKPLEKAHSMPEALRRRVERDLGEHTSLTRPLRRSPWRQ